MTSHIPSERRPYDQQALARAALGGAALCTVVGIEGSFSRRMGAQLAIDPDGGCTGDLADGCLEASLALEAAQARDSGRRRLVRYGRGSEMIDFQLPCGSGLDILIDPAPDASVCRDAMAQLVARQPVSLSLPLDVDGGPMAVVPEHEERRTQRIDRVFHRHYRPELQLVVAGTGPEVDALCGVAESSNVRFQALRPLGRNDALCGLSLGTAPANVDIDQWTAVVLLFHDHEWESALLRWALRSPALLIGAQGGEKSRQQRIDMLRASGCSVADIARVKSPIGLIKHARDPDVLALSVLAECVATYQLPPAVCA